MLHYYYRLFDLVHYIDHHQAETQPYKQVLSNMGLVHCMIWYVLGNNILVPINACCQQRLNNFPIWKVHNTNHNNKIRYESHQGLEKVTAKHKNGFVEAHSWYHQKKLLLISKQQPFVSLAYGSHRQHKHGLVRRARGWPVRMAWTALLAASSLPGQIQSRLAPWSLCSLPLKSSNHNQSPKYRSQSCIYIERNVDIKLQKSSTWWFTLIEMTKWPPAFRK